jgi:hypothetical protein
MDLKEKPPFNDHPIEGAIISIAETPQGNLAFLYEHATEGKKVFIHSSSAINATFTCLRNEDGYRFCYGRSDYGGQLAPISDDPFANSSSF